MNKLFKIVGFSVIWGCMFLSTYYVWAEFGATIGILFFLFGAGLAAFVGFMFVCGVAKLFGIDID